MFTLIQPELNEVFAQIEKDYSLKAGHLSQFIPDFELNSIDQSLRPALVILAGKLFIGCTRKTIVLAGIVQLIYLAQEIHNRIPDNCPKEVPQFPVLVGDYLFSQFFKRLSDHNLLEWLAPLSSVICEMNEGGIVRRELLEKGMAGEEEYGEVIKQEHGLLTALACKIGGAVSGADQWMIDALEQFGLHVGMAWGIIKEKYPISPIRFLSEAKALLSKIPSGPERDVMMNTVECLREMAAVHHVNGRIGLSAAAY